jgi:hypothetical protein
MVLALLRDTALSLLRATGCAMSPRGCATSRNAPPPWSPCSPAHPPSTHKPCWHRHLHLRACILAAILRRTSGARSSVGQSARFTSVRSLVRAQSCPPPNFPSWATKKEPRSSPGSSAWRRVFALLMQLLMQFSRGLLVSPDPSAPPDIAGTCPSSHGRCRRKKKRPLTVRQRPLRAMASLQRDCQPSSSSSG